MPLHTNNRSIWERCIKCGRRWHWNINPKDRIDNKRYLAVHIREYCQPTGRTKKTYFKLYGNPENNLVNPYKMSD